MYAEKNPSTPVDATLTDKLSIQEKPTILYPSDSYQKVLDYHITEILLTTIVLGVILLLRLYR